MQILPFNHRLVFPLRVPCLLVSSLAIFAPSSPSAASVVANTRANSTSHRSVLFQDTFDDGIIPPGRYIVSGGATMTESGGRLTVTLPSVGSKFRMNTSDLVGQECFVMLYDIAHNGFAVGDALEFAWLSPSSVIPGFEFKPVAVTFERPFWNKCKYKVIQKDHADGFIGFTGPYTKEEDCPSADCIRLDWLGAGKFQIEIKGSSSMFKDPVRMEGMEYEAGTAPTFNHANDTISGYTIEKVGGDPIVVSIDEIVVDSVHQGDGLQSVTMVPDVYDRGQITGVTISTDRPFLVPGLTTINMGPEVKIQNINILNSTLATANIEIDQRARNAGHYVTLEASGFFLSSDFTIRPLDPGLPLPANTAPTVEIQAPTFVPENQPFNVRVIWDDPDDAFIQGVVVVQELPSTAEVFNTGYMFLDTSSTLPVVQDHGVQGLPSGLYKIIVVPNDGLADEQMVAAALTVTGSASIPTLGKWGLVVLGLGLLCAGLVLTRRAATIAES